MPMAPMQEIAVDTDAVSGVAWSADGRRLAACGHGSVVILEAEREGTAHATCPFLAQIMSGEAPSSCTAFTFAPALMRVCTQCSPPW